MKKRKMISLIRIEWTNSQNASRYCRFTRLKLRIPLLTSGSPLSRKKLERRKAPWQGKRKRESWDTPSRRGFSNVAIASCKNSWVAFHSPHDITRQARYKKSSRCKTYIDSLGSQAFLSLPDCSFQAVTFFLVEPFSYWVRQAASVDSGRGWPCSSIRKASFIISSLVWPALPCVKTRRVSGQAWESRLVSMRMSDVPRTENDLGEESS